MTTVSVGDEYPRVARRYRLKEHPSLSVSKRTHQGSPLVDAVERGVNWNERRSRSYKGDEEGGRTEAEGWEGNKGRPKCAATAQWRLGKQMSTHSRKASVVDDK